MVRTISRDPHRHSCTVTEFSHWHAKLRAMAYTVCRPIANVKPALVGYRSLVRRGTGPKGHWSEGYGVGIHCREVM